MRHRSGDPAGWKPAVTTDSLPFPPVGAWSLEPASTGGRTGSGGGSSDLRSQPSNISLWISASSLLLSSIYEKRNCDRIQIYNLKLLKKKNDKKAIIENSEKCDWWRQESEEGTLQEKD